MHYQLKEYRKKRRLTQAELAELSGVSRFTIIKLESEEDVDTNMSTLCALARALNVSVRTLFVP